MTPRDFFIHIGAMLALYVSVFSLLALLFQVINIAYPDPINYYMDPYSSGIRWAIASIFIVFPVYLVLSWLISKDFRINPDKRNLGVRRWLVYLTLFFAGITIATDLIVLINSFLGGEITSRFVLKVLSILILVGLVFAYYLLDLKTKRVKIAKLPKTFGIIAIVIVLASLVAGFGVMGSPITQRQIRYDQQKISDLQGIQWQVINYWQQKGALPNDLSELSDPISSYMVPPDPQGGSYEYRKVGTLSFELCAEFNRSSKDDIKNRSISRPYITEPYFYGVDSGGWEHEQGKKCFERTIDPDFYPTKR